MVAFNFNYLANFSVGEESKTVITAFGKLFLSFKLANIYQRNNLKVLVSG